MAGNVQIDAQWLTVLLTVVQVLMGVVLTFGMFILNGLRDDLRKMGDAFSNLQREVLKDGMPKTEFDRYRQETGVIIHHLQNDIVEANMKAAIVAAKVGVEFPRQR